MGCDIHMMAEKRVDGVWRHIPDVSLCDDRHYDLFAILADVRNGRGFAGVKTGEGFVPISDPRGVPHDASPEYLAYVEDMGCDGHSHSFHTVRQIMDYDWTQTTKKQGIVTLKEWADYKIQGYPTSWCGGVSGPNVRILPLKEVEDAFKSAKISVYDVYHEWPEAIAKLALGDGNIYTTVTWGIPYYRAGRDLLGETLPQLWRRGSPDDVRIVFYFDN